MQDCVDWAASVCKEMNIPLSASSISGLASINGVMLMKLKRKEFNNLCDSIIGPVLYKKMKAKRHQLKNQSGMNGFIYIYHILLEIFH